MRCDDKFIHNNNMYALREFRAKFIATRTICMLRRAKWWRDYTPRVEGRSLGAEALIFFQQQQEKISGDI